MGLQLLADEVVNDCCPIDSESDGTSLHGMDTETHATTRECASPAEDEISTTTCSVDIRWVPVSKAEARWQEPNELVKLLGLSRYKYVLHGGSEHDYYTLSFINTCEGGCTFTFEGGQTEDWTRPCPPGNHTLRFTTKDSPIIVRVTKHEAEGGLWWEE